jgi:hypothetical protein
MHPKRRRASADLVWRPRRYRHGGRACGACCQDNSQRLRHPLSQSSSGVNCFEFTYNPSGLLYSIIPVRYPVANILIIWRVLRWVGIYRRRIAFWTLVLESIGATGRTLSYEMLHFLVYIAEESETFLSVDAQN